MRVLTAAEMQACDRATTERFGVESLQLMRNASRAVAAFAREQFPHARRVLVLCGRGNNGGDGSMAARLLAESGLEVEAILLGSAGELKGDAAAAWRELQQAQSCRLHSVESAEQLASLPLDADLVLDAIVGTGFTPPLKGLALAALDWIKRSSAPVLSIDLPSGWPADSTREQPEAETFPSDAVITFTAPKPAHVFGQLTRRWFQPVVVAPIGSPDEAIVSHSGLHWSGGAQQLYHAPRPADSNKGNFGHVLVVGGSFGQAGGKAGAPGMTSLAAMRTGAGLVTAAVPAPALPIIAGYAPELMTRPLAANEAGEISPQALNGNALADLLKGISVLAIGPGMGQSDDTRKFQTCVLSAANIPTVIDADALNNLAHAIAAHADPLPELTKNGRILVLTPHPGEMARLAGISTKEVQAGRLEVARKFAVGHGVTVVLKGARTLIAHPDGRVAVNTTGNPGQAKGGSGDLLTGIIAGMLAQFPHQPARAVEAAVFLHGLAADLAVRGLDEHTMLATDTLKAFSRAFQFHSRGASGYVWLQGLPHATGAQASPEEDRA